MLGEAFVKVFFTFIKTLVTSIYYAPNCIIVGVVAKITSRKYSHFILRVSYFCAKYIRNSVRSLSMLYVLSWCFGLQGCMSLRIVMRSFILLSKLWINSFYNYYNSTLIPKLGNEFAMP